MTQEQLSLLTEPCEEGQFIPWGTTFTWMGMAERATRGDQTTEQLTLEGTT